MKRRYRFHVRTPKQLLHKFISTVREAIHRQISFSLGHCPNKRGGVYPPPLCYIPLWRVISTGDLSRLAFRNVHPSNPYHPFYTYRFEHSKAFYGDLKQSLFNRCLSGWKRMKVDVDEWKPMQVDENLWQLMNVDENWWKWIKVDKSGAKLIKLMTMDKIDENGYKWIKIDESGWKYLRCYMHLWCRIYVWDKTSDVWVAVSGLSAVCQRRLPSLADKYWTWHFLLFVVWRLFTGPPSVYYALMAS